MSDLLGIGASGLGSYRTALSTIGDNVANAETQGYVRRDVKLSSLGAIRSSDPIYRTGTGPGGVGVSGIVRAADAYKIADSRLTAADAARAEARSRWLALAEKQLPDDDSGIGSKLTAVFTAGAALAADPDGDLPRERMMTSIDDAASALRTSAAGLKRISDGIGTEADESAAALNTSLNQLDKINAALRKTQPGTAAQATALDERDRLLDDIAGKVGIDTRFDASGAVTVTLAGSSGTTLVDEKGAGQVRVSHADDGRLSLALDHGGGQTALSPVGGSLSGLIDSAAAVTGRRRQLDAVATDFAASLNAWNAGGKTPAGTSGAALLDAGGGAAAIRLAVTDPAMLAAASNDSANGNALALDGLRGTGGVEAKAASLVAGLSQLVAGAKSESAAAATRATASALARDEGTGVDLDREAAELIRFQQAYDGSAKIVQVARETLQSILQLF